MNNILIPWDEISEEVKRDFFDSAGLGKAEYDEYVKKFTTPLRPPDEWTDDEWEEWAKLVNQRNTNAAYKRDIDYLIANKALEIAARPPKRSAVEEMDYAVTHNSADIAVKWQAVKAEREL